MPRLALLLCLALCLHAADTILFDAAAKDAAAMVSANEPEQGTLGGFAIAQSKGKAVLKVDCLAAKSYPGITIKAAKPWNLAAHAWVEAELTNVSDQAISVTLRIDNPGDWKSNPWNSEVQKIEPGATSRIRVWFGRSWGKPGYKLDPAQVGQALLFLSQPKQPTTFTVRRLIAGGAAGDKP